jgi:Mn2+/Fe2+ NRAMP family transporter
MRTSGAMVTSRWSLIGGVAGMILAVTPSISFAQSQAAQTGVGHANAARVQRSSSSGLTTGVVMGAAAVAAAVVAIVAAVSGGDDDDTPSAAAGTTAATTTGNP